MSPHVRLSHYEPSRQSMDSDKKQAITPEFAGTLFFAIFAALFLIFTKYTLIPLQGSLHLPLYPALFIALVSGAIIGRKFAGRLAKENRWLRLFLLGLMMGILAIFIASISALIRSCLYDTSFLPSLHYWQDYFIAYGLIVLSIALVIGIWLVPLCGLAAIYFNKRFLPGLIAADNRNRCSENTLSS